MTLTYKQKMLGIAALLLACSTTAQAGGNAHFDLGQWRGYMGDLLDPGLTEASLSNHKATASADDWKAHAREQLLPEFARELFTEAAIQAGQRASAYAISSRNSSLGLISTPALNNANHQLNLFQQNFVEPGIAARISEKVLINVGAVLVSQQFGSSNLDHVRTGQTFTDSRANTFDHGFAAANINNNNTLNSPNGINRFDSTQGIGARFGVSYSLLPWLELGTSYQGRIDTEALNEITGVYADPAELDIPSRLGASVALATSKRSQLKFGVEQVGYSSINSFTSNLLPGRFLSLLGDSNSPAFDYRDLTLYSASWAWQPSSRWSLQAAFSTRTQPLPDNSLLANALRSELASTTYGLFVSRKLNLGTVRFGASLAPADIAFGGNALGVVSDDLGQNFEASLNWNWVY